MSKCHIKAPPNVTFKQQEWVKGCYLGIAWTTGDAITYYVVPESENVYHRKVARMVVLPCHLDEQAPRQKHVREPSSDLQVWTTELPRKSYDARTIGNAQR